MAEGQKIILLKSLFKQHCSGVPLKDLGLNQEQENTIKAFLRACSVGKPATQISLETRLPVRLCADLKQIQKNVRRDLKNTKTLEITSTLPEILKRRLEGLPWLQIQTAGAGYSQCRKVQQFLSEVKKGSSSGDIERKLKLNRIEVQTLIRVLEENQKVVA